MIFWVGFARIASACLPKQYSGPYPIAQGWFAVLHLLPEYRRHGDQDVDQEARKAQDKPVLSAEGFQRLLAAAYILQTTAGRRLSPIGASGTNSFAGGAIVQRRTPCVMVRGPQLPPQPNIWLRRSASWRMVEALAIAAIFCMMMGASIHRLPARPGRTSLTPGKPEQENASEPARSQESFLAPAQQPVVARKPLPRPDGDEGDIVAEDVVIRHQKLAVNFLNQAARKTTSSRVQRQLLTPKSTTSVRGIRSTFGRGADMAAADTVVEYGADVKMWLGSPKRAGLDRPAH